MAKQINKKTTKTTKSKSNVSKLKLDLALCEEKASILDLIPTPIMAVDKEFTITYINRVGASTVKKSATECIGQKCFNLFNTKSFCLHLCNSLSLSYLINIFPDL